MGGKVSHEFMVPAGEGEDIVLHCEGCGRSVTYKEGMEEKCGSCGAEASKRNCVEVGHIFKLGTKYTSSLGVQFLDAAGQKKPVIMGCYGIGVSRLISAVIEQNHDESGIVWPLEVTPYQVSVLALSSGDSAITEYAGQIHDQLEQAGIATLCDNRDERAGVKFNDTELIGVPVSVIVGQKSLSQQKIELKTRRDKEVAFIDRDNLVEEVKKRLGETDGSE